MLLEINFPHHDDKYGKQDTPSMQEATVVRAMTQEEQVVTKNTKQWNKSFLPCSLARRDVRW